MYNEKHVNPTSLYSLESKVDRPFEVGAICVPTTISLGLTNYDIIRYKITEVLEETKQVKAVREGFSCPRYTLEMTEIRVVE